MTAIFKKEMRAYFNNMSGYIFLFFFVLLTGVFFFVTNVLRLNGEYFYTIINSTVLFLIMIPMLTMRLFAEEYSQKTDQLLYTAPVSTASVVLAKFLSAVSLLFIGLLITGIYPFFISRIGELPINRIFGTYLGYFLLGSCFVSIGMFISVLTNSQVIAATGAFAAIFLFYISDQLINAIPPSLITSVVFVAVVTAVLSYTLYDSTKSLAAGIACFLTFIAAAAAVYFINSSFYDGLAVSSLKWLSLMARFGSFALGILTVEDTVYYLSFAAFFNYLTIRIIEKRRWA